MDSTKRKDILRLAQNTVTDALEAAIARAYDEGVRDGEAKAASDFATMFAQRFGGALPEVAGKSVEAQRLRTPPPGQSSERRKYGYGVVSGVIRNVIWTKRIDGVSVDDIVSLTASDFGIEANKTQVRESLKRMKQSDEIRTQGRKWFPTEKFRRDLIVDYDENEAPATLPLDASDADGGVKPPSNENVVGFTRPR